MAAPSKLASRSILVVDDRIEMLDMLSDALAAVGAKVIAALNGEEALAMLRGHDVDAVVCDLAMPRMNGFELIKKLRASENTARRKLPVIAISGDPSWTYQDPFEAARAGFDFHLAKPVMPLELIGHLERMVGGLPPASGAGTSGRFRRVG